MSFFRWGVMSFWVPRGRAFSILEVYLAKVSDAVSRRWLRSGNDSPRNHLLGLWFGSILAETMCDQILIFDFFQDGGLFFVVEKKINFSRFFLLKWPAFFFYFYFFIFFFFLREFFFPSFEISKFPKLRLRCCQSVPWVWITRVFVGFGATWLFDGGGFFDSVIGACSSVMGTLLWD